MRLINPESCQLQLSFFIFSKEVELLLLSFELSLVLLCQGVLIISQLKLHLIIKSIFFLSQSRLLISLVISNNLGCLFIKLLLVILDLLTQHTACILGFHLKIMLHECQLLFKFALLLLRELQDISIKLIPQLSFLLG